jgi:hypothetical protein
MKPTVFSAGVDECNDCLNQIFELFYNFRYKHFYHSSSYHILPNIMENVLHSAAIWMLEWLFVMKPADI